MINRNVAAIAVPHLVVALGSSAALKLLREHGLVDQSRDRSFRGCGNAAARRQGIDTAPHGCDCVVCVVYGGDCSYQMWRDSHSEWHRAQRGVKTRGQ